MSHMPPFQPRLPHHCRTTTRNHDRNPRIGFTAVAKQIEKGIAPRGRRLLFPLAWIAENPSEPRPVFCEVSFPSRQRPLRKRQIGWRRQNGRTLGGRFRRTKRRPRRRARHPASRTAKSGWTSRPPALAIVRARQKPALIFKGGKTALQRMRGTDPTIFCCTIFNLVERRELQYAVSTPSVFGVLVGHDEFGNHLLSAPRHGSCAPDSKRPLGVIYNGRGGKPRWTPPGWNGWASPQPVDVPPTEEDYKTPSLAATAYGEPDRPRRSRFRPDGSNPQTGPTPAQPAAIYDGRGALAPKAWSPGP